MEYTLSAKVWFSEWYFVSLPREMANEIRENGKFLEEGRVSCAARWWG